MAKAKYKKNSRGEYHTRIWNGTYNPDGSKHRINLKSKKSSADLERKVNALKSQVKNGNYVQDSDILFWTMPENGYRPKKASGKRIHRTCTKTSLKHIYHFWIQ